MLKTFPSDKLRVFILSVRAIPETLLAFFRNQCSRSSGIAGLLGLEYAHIECLPVKMRIMKELHMGYLGYRGVPEPGILIERQEILALMNQEPCAVHAEIR